MAEDVQQDQQDVREEEQAGVGEPEAPQERRQRDPLEDYRIRGNGVFEVKMGLDGPYEVCISHAPIHIIGRSVDVLDQTIYLSLEWGGEERRVIEIPRVDAMTSRKLLESAARGFPVNSSNATALTKFLAAYEAARRGVIPVTRSSSRPGWQGVDGQMGFLWGSLHITPTGRITREGQPNHIKFIPASPGAEQLGAGMRRQGEFKDWTAAVEKVVSYPKVMASIYASLSAPLLEVLKTPNYAVDHNGESSTGKTISQRGGASCWGNPNENERDSFISSWSTTLCGVEQRAALLNGMPLLMDDTGRVGEYDRKRVEEALFLIGNGRGKNRGGIRGAAATDTFRTLLISSGEVPLRSFLTKAGGVMRTLALEGSPFGGKDATTGAVAKGFDRAIRENYGHAGPGLVIWLLRNREKWDALRQYHKEREEHYRAKGGEAARLADHAATLDVTAKVARVALGLTWLPQEPAEVLWEGLVEAATDADSALEALEKLISWGLTDERAFYSDITASIAAIHVPGEKQEPYNSPIGGWRGKRTDKYLAFIPKHGEEFLKRAGYDPDIVVKRWQNKGWIDKSSEKEARWKVRVDIEGDKIRCWRFRFYTLEQLGLTVPSMAAVEDVAADLQASEA